eukprot:Amastigsp_a174805_1663.p4 type:complete len:109 gc:universal Amastigsp_a174805_1663:592-918(+)
MTRPSCDWCRCATGTSRSTTSRSSAPQRPSARRNASPLTLRAGSLLSAQKGLSRSSRTMARGPRACSRAWSMLSEKARTPSRVLRSSAIRCTFLGTAIESGWPTLMEP